jgi:putative DNA primase/helicase
MTAESIAQALGGRKAGTTWMARCPAHADREPSLSIKDGDGGRVLVRCHAGCDQERVIATLRSRGLWTENGTRRFIRPAPRAATGQPDRDDAKRSKAALAIWQSAISAHGSLVEAYLASRGLHLPPPSTLRFHAGLKHPSGGIWPAMVGLVTRGADDTPLAIHRTFLACNGGGKAPVDPQKMMLGPCHRCGSACRATC